MSNNTKGKPEGLLGLSIAEARTILWGVLCTDNTGKIDFDKLTIRGNYKNPTSAGSAYRQAKRKFLDLNNTELPEGTTAGAAAAAATAGEGNAGGGASPTTPKKTPGRRKKAKDLDTPTGQIGEVDAQASPLAPKPKRQRKTPVKKEAAATPVKMENVGDSANASNVFAQTEAADLIRMETEYSNPYSNPVIKTEEERAMVDVDVNIDAEFDDMEKEKDMAMT